MRLTIFVFVFLFLVSCSTKVVTYYDTDKTQIIGISNRIYADSNLECLGTFLHYSGGNEMVYEGIGLELTLLKDSSVQIKELDIKIKPTNNTSFKSPVSFACSDIITLEQIKGKDFNAVRTIINQSNERTITILVKDNVDKYDSLYADVRILYLANNNHYEVSRNKIYIKGYYKKQFTR